MENEKNDKLSKSAEEYLDAIYGLVRERGFATVVDIAASLDVKPSSVTHMLQKLDRLNLVEYQRYRGVTLTTKGENLARSMERRHRVLRTFLELLSVDKAIADGDAEEIEHTVHPETIEKLTKFIEFVKNTPGWLEKYKHFEETGKYSKSSNEKT